MPKAKKNFSRGRAQPYVMRSSSSGPIRMGPAPIRANLEMKHHYRFTSSAATLTSITDTLLLTAAGVMAVSATAANSIHRTVKVNRIEVWTPPAAQGSAATCSVAFPAPNNSPAREYSDTTISTAEPAHVIAVPPPQSLCSFWQSGTGVTMFNLVAPAGSIIDVWLSLVIGDATLGAAAVLVGATTGVMYYCSLDSATAAGSIYTPVGLTRL